MSCKESHDGIRLENASFWSFQDWNFSLRVPLQIFTRGSLGQAQFNVGYIYFCKFCSDKHFLNSETPQWTVNL